MKKTISMCIGLCGCVISLNAQSRDQLISITPQSMRYQEEKNSLGGYVRSSAYGGTSKFDFATTFVEGQFQADVQRGFEEGYVFFKADTRLRNGQFFGVNETQLEIKDLYVGYKREKFELTLGNQSLLWGRGIGANPTNNLTPTNGFFLSATGNDQNLSNFMVRTKYSINPGLDWEVVGVPIYKASVSRGDLLTLPAGIIPGTQDLPENKLKNGSLATRLNWNLGPMGASVSYFNGYNAAQAIVPVVTSTGILANQSSFRKQTIGADFGIRIPGNPDGTSNPTNDALILGEIGYDKIENPTDAAWVPQSNLTYTVGMVKSWYDKYKIDNVTLVLSYVGKYTPNFITPIQPTDYTDPDFGYKMLTYSQRNLTQQIFGQQKQVIHSTFGVLSKTFDKAKFSLSLMGMYNITVKSSMISPRATWNITKSLSTTVGGFYLNGPGTEVVSPTLNGVFCELKQTF